MNKIPTEGMRIVNQRTGDEFLILPVTQKKDESTTTKVLAALAIGVMITMAVSVLCRLARKLFT